MEKENIVQRPDSPWAFPIHMMKKANSTWQLCCEYMQVNLVTKSDQYPPLHILYSRGPDP